MHIKIVSALTLAVFALLFFQGLVAAGNYVRSDDLRMMKNENIQLNAMSIYTTNNYPSSIAVSGKKVVWVEYINRSDGYCDPDVFMYNNDTGLVTNYGTPSDSDYNPDVGNHVVWEHWEKYDEYIDSDVGVVYHYPNETAMSPKIYKDTVAFIDRQDIYDRIGYMKIGEKTYFISPKMSIDSVAISEKYIGFNEYIYSFKNNTYWKVLYAGYVWAIYDDWVIYGGRSNFGNDVYMGVYNLETGEDKRIADYYVGEYGGFGSVDFDEYWVVWSINGRGYLYNVLSERTYNITNGEVDSIAIGEGKIAWIDGSTGTIWYADTPNPGSFVEVYMEDLTNASYDVEYDLLLITDSQGRKFGGENEQTYDIYREIPGGIAVMDYKVKLYRVPADDPNNLNYQVIAKNDGHYTLKIKFISAMTRGFSMQTLWVNATNIPIKKNEINQYIVDWTKVASHATDAVTLSIDSNGDGIFETKITAPNHIDAQTKESGSNGLFSFQIGGMMCILGIIIIVLIIAVIVIAVIKK